MGLFASTTNKHPTIKVLIRNLDCEYLADRQKQWGLTRDRSQAAAFDYLQDRVEEILRALRRRRGLVLVAEAQDPAEAYEICDRCARRLTPLNMHFDGKRFLCPRCATPPHPPSS